MATTPGEDFEHHHPEQQQEQQDQLLEQQAAYEATSGALVLDSTDWLPPPEATIWSLIPTIVPIATPTSTTNNNTSISNSNNNNNHGTARLTAERTTPTTLTSTTSTTTTTTTTAAVTLPWTARASLAAHHNTSSNVGLGGTGSGQHHPYDTTTTTTSSNEWDLVRAVERLDRLEKDEQSLTVPTAVLTRELTEFVTHPVSVPSSGPSTQQQQYHYANSEQAMLALEQLGLSVPRRVCQHPFRKNDIVWVCRTCQADETCVLCHACYSSSSHVGHDVAFYHAQAGGCCDCGDPDGALCTVLVWNIALYFFYIIFIVSW